MTKSHILELVGQRTALIARNLENPKLATTDDDIVLLTDFLGKGAFEILSRTEKLATTAVVKTDDAQIAEYLTSMRSELENALVYWIMADWFMNINKDLEAEYRMNYENEIAKYRHDPRDVKFVERTGQYL